MLRLDDMDHARLGASTAHVVEHALASGLAWDEALAATASDEGLATPDQCAAQAERRLKCGMMQSADVPRAWLG